MNEVTIIVDLSDADKNRTLRNRFAAARGVKEITVKDHKPKRSNSFNRYYFGTVVKAFVEYNREQGTLYSHEMAHNIIKMAVLPAVAVPDPVTGEVRYVPADTHNLDTNDFSDFVLLASAWIGELGIELPDPPRLPARRVA